MKNVLQFLKTAFWIDNFKIWWLCLFVSAAITMILFVVNDDFLYTYPYFPHWVFGWIITQLTFLGLLLRIVPRWFIK